MLSAVLLLWYQIYGYRRNVKKWDHQFSSRHFWVQVNMELSGEVEGGLLSFLTTQWNLLFDPIVRQM